MDAVNGLAVFVVHDDPDLVRATMLAELDLPFPVLVDLDRSAYRDWGLGRASIPTIFLDAKVWLQYARLLVRGGERLRRAGRDPLQMGGDFVVGTDGRLVYARPQRRDDRPPVGVLLRELRRATVRAG